jgi:hypothetical protein
MWQTQVGRRRKLWQAGGRPRLCALHRLRNIGPEPLDVFLAHLIAHLSGRNL